MTEILRGGAIAFLVCLICTSAAQAGPGAPEFEEIGLGHCLGAMEEVRAVPEVAGLESGSDGVLAWCSFTVHVRKAQSVTGAFESWAERALESGRYVRTGPLSLETNAWREPVMEVSLIRTDGAVTFTVRDLNKEA